VPFILEVMKKADHPQVGFNFNVVHWCIVDAQRDWRPLLRENSAKLFCVLLSGYSATQPRKNLPLDEGTFDQRPLLATLDEVGYRGPVGLMCYGIPGDLSTHLARSMNVWRAIHSNEGGAK
jgi:sugar phosphate isomerase/epimerase